MRPPIEYRNKLVERHLHLARITVLRHKRNHLDDSDIDDLVQTASIAMIDAANTWDPLGKHPFASYAVYCMKKTLSRAACRLRLLVSVPHTYSGAALSEQLKRFRCSDISEVGDLVSRKSRGVSGDTLVLEGLWTQIKGVLTQRQYRAMYAMYGPEGLDSMTEVAAAFGVTKQAISSLIESARVRLLACDVFRLTSCKQGRKGGDHV